MQSSKGDTDVKNRLLDSVGEGEGGMIWENSTETYTLSYVKQMTRTSLMHEAGHPKLVLWDNPEIEWGGMWEEGSGWGGYMYTCGWFMLMYDKKPSQYCKVIILQLKLINFKKFKITHKLELISDLSRSLNKKST